MNQQQPLDDHQGMLIPTMGEIVEEAMEGGPISLDLVLEAVKNVLTPDQQLELGDWIAQDKEARPG